MGYSDTEKLPPATIIVASYNRPEKIRTCLERLVTLDYPDFEVLVVDDGSPVPIKPIAAPFGGKVRVVRQQNQGPAAARNCGVRAARNDFILFTDDDCLPRTDWIRTLGKAHLETPVALLGGRVENALTRDIFASASQGLCDYLYDYYQAGSGHAPFFTTNNMAFSRHLFEKIGGLDGTFRFASEDRDFGMRWQKAGLTLRYVPGAVVAHHHDMTLRTYWRQHASYGAGAKKLHHAMDTRGDPRPKVEPFAFYRGILLHPFKARARAALAQSFLMGLSQVAMVWGYFTSPNPESDKG